MKDIDNNIGDEIQETHKDQNKIKLHLILDQSDEAVVEVIKEFDNIGIVQWDYSFDTAFQWTMHNEAEKIDVFLASEFAHVSVTDEGKQVSRDTALLRRIKDIYLMRPKAKFVLLCDEDRELPENRHFLSNLVAIGVYDFRIMTTLTEETLRKIIEEPKRDITHVQEYLPENVAGTIKPFQKKEIVREEEPKKELKAVDIFATISKFGRKDVKERKKPKVKHVIEKVRPSVVSFYPIGASEANASFLAKEFAVKLAAEKAKVALIEMHSSGIPRMAFETGIASTVKTVETVFQRIEDEEDITPALNTPKEAADNAPYYDKAILNKIKTLPATLHVLPGRHNIMPNIHPFKSIKGSTLDIAPNEIVNQLIFGHDFDCVVFVLSGSLTYKTVFHSIRVSNYTFLVTDQHSAHISWLKQNLTIMERSKMPLKNIRIIIYPYYELPNIRLTDIETALDMDIDYTLPDMSREFLNSTWGKDTLKSRELDAAITEMIRETTGRRLTAKAALA